MRIREKADWDGKLRCTSCREVKEVRENFCLGGDGEVIQRCIPCCLEYQAKYKRRIIIEVPIRTISASNKREGWRARARRVREERDGVRTAWLAAGRPRLPVPCVVRLERRGPRRLDDDNLRSALKGVRDEVAAILGVDDADMRVTWKYRQTTGLKSGVTITIRER